MSLCLLGQSYSVANIDHIKFWLSTIVKEASSKESNLLGTVYILKSYLEYIRNKLKLSAEIEIFRPELKILRQWEDNLVHWLSRSFPQVSQDSSKLTKTVLLNPSCTPGVEGLGSSGGCHGCEMTGPWRRRCFHGWRSHRNVIRIIKEKGSADRACEG